MVGAVLKKLFTLLFIFCFITIIISLEGCVWYHTAPIVLHLLFLIQLKHTVQLSMSVHTVPPHLQPCHLEQQHSSRCLQTPCSRQAPWTACKVLTFPKASLWEARFFHIQPLKQQITTDWCRSMHENPSVFYPFRPREISKYIKQHKSH